MIKGEVKQTAINVHSLLSTVAHRRANLPVCQIALFDVVMKHSKINI